MRRTRSEGKSRFWLFGGHEYTAAVGEFLFFNLLVAGLLVCGTIYALWSGISAIERLSSSSHPLNSLRRPLTEAERHAGRVRLSGTVGQVTEGQESGPGPPPLCLVTKKIKSGKSWHEVFRQTISNGAVIRTDSASRSGTVGAEGGAQEEWTIDVDGVRWEQQQVCPLEATRRLCRRGTVHRSRRGAVCHRAGATGAA